MLNYPELSRHRRVFKTLTGLSTEDFNQSLLVFFKNI